jgi:hypothetical protein
MPPKDISTRLGTYLKGMVILGPEYTKDARFFAEISRFCSSWQLRIAKYFKGSNGPATFRLTRADEFCTHSRSRKGQLHMKYSKTSPLTFRNFKMRALRELHLGKLRVWDKGGKGQGFELTCSKLSSSL